jgi:hypothetical protein
MGLTATELRAINPRLVPLLAHDRAGFGGSVFTLGLTTALCLWCNRPSRNLHQAVALAGGVSLTSALVVHFGVGYTDAWHLLPAMAAASCLLFGLALEHPGLPAPSEQDQAERTRTRGSRRGGDDVPDNLPPPMPASAHAPPEVNASR